jgi:nucleotide-binding universal stress UspA family protein
MESGSPVLLVPPGQDNVHLGTIVVGWKNTREARRAISSAMPLLKAADRVLVVQICEDGQEFPAERELEDVVGRLDRQGVVAEWESFPKSGIDAGEDLMQVAMSWAADLLVLGAYGHSRAREWAFGGVTRDLLAVCAKPILFSH